MKTLLFGLFFLLSAFSVQAQRLVIGEKAPEVRVAKWTSAAVPVMSGKPFLIDFFHSSNNQCVANLVKLNIFHGNYRGKVNVILISREEHDKVAPFLEGKGYGFFTGLDDGGKTFTNYGVRFVPFAALVDTKGRLVWTGNVSALTNEIIDKALK
ncbi:MAG: TlpA family protein disulfide reductase [Rikenellaceae bacterium]|nr:TlpA family protein disulfide reductase [Rikenellaceae bacterium]